MLLAALLIGGVIVIVVGADWFTDSAVWMARRSGVSQVIIGATVCSLATTLPELSVSVYAAFDGHTQLAIGNAVGSAIANIGLIMGVSILLRHRPIERQPFVTNSSFLLLGALTLTAFAWNQTLTRIEAVIMLSLVGLFMLMSLQSARRSRAEYLASEQVAVSTAADESVVLPLSKFVVGAAMIIAGGRALVTSGVSIAQVLGIPPLIVGLTVMSIGTSLPELVTALAAQLKGHQDLSIGNLLGASFMNLTLVTGASALVRPLPITRSNLWFDFPVMMLLVILLIVFGLRHRTLTRGQGGILVGLYLAYVTTLLVVFT